MNMNEYQAEASKTAIYPKQYSIMYPSLGLCAEAGEVANKVKKIYRDEGGVLSVKAQESIASEVSDCLWYLACLASDLGYNLSDLAEANLEKLRDRMERGVIQGSGDTR